MPIEIVNVGAAPDDGTGDLYRVAMQKVNTSLAYLDSAKANAADVAIALDSKVDKVAGSRLITTTEANKLASIATGATANATDAQLRDRSTHTGTQAISTISGLQTELDARDLQGSVGSDPNQIPSNQHLGALAFFDTLGAMQVTRHTRDSRPGDVWYEWVSNTQLKKNFHGFDGVIRSITETYA